MDLGNKMFKGVVWSAIERISIQAIQFLLGIVLARLLTPTEYGTVGLLMVFIAVSNVFINSGFSSALIYKQDRTEDDLSTAFLFNLGISVFCYILLWFTAPYISAYYEIDILTNLLRVLSLSLIINALHAVPATILTIKLDFKTLGKINFTATAISGAIAIYLAYNGFGVWALVMQTLLISTISLLLMWIFVRWIPNWHFSKTSFRSLFSYGSNLLASSLMTRIVSDLATLFIGKVLSTKDLGFYSRGMQFADFVSSTVGSIINRVLLSGLATIQDNKAKLVKHTKQIIVITSLLIFPVFCGLFVLAEPIVTVLLTEKWLMAVPIMQIFCVARMFTILSGINVNLLYVLGRTDLALRQQIAKIVVRAIFVFIALKYGIIFIALAELISTIIHMYINAYYPGKIMNYGLFRQLRDILPIIIVSLVMSASVFLVVQFISNDIVKLLVGPLVGILVYSSLIYMLKLEEVRIIKDKIKDFKF